MGEIPKSKRNYQAEVYLTLGAVIQGITVAALGNELADALRQWAWPELGWILATGLLSLLLCIMFWYTFMNNYFFAFRVINLTAKAHFGFATLYLVLGLQQLIAIQFLDQPQVWLTFYVLLIATTLVGSWLSAPVLVIDDAAVQQAMNYSPNTRLFLAVFALNVVSLIVWFVFPGLDTPLYWGLALGGSGLGLVLFMAYYMRVFQRHLETPLE